jgi:hypothetical protein
MINNETILEIVPHKSFGPIVFGVTSLDEAISYFGPSKRNVRAGYFLLWCSGFKFAPLNQAKS